MIRRGGLKLSIIIFLLMIALTLPGCFSRTVPTNAPSIELTGDIQEAVIINRWDDLPWVDLKLEGQSVPGLPLKEWVDTLEPFSTIYSLILVADDAPPARIEASQLETAHLIFSAAERWTIILGGEPYPVFGWNLGKMVVVSDSPPWEYTLSVISPRQNLIQLSPGQWYAAGLQSVSVAELMGGSLSESYRVIGKNGQVTFASDDAYLEWHGKRIQYSDSNGATLTEQVAGIMVDPPAAAITDLYHDVVDDLDQDQSVLVILLDGFGYHQYQHAKENGYIPFLSSLGEAEPALAAYRPVTNAGMAAMLTGEWPHVNGVDSREQRLIQVPTFFQHILNQGKQGVLLEGDIGILHTEVPPTLHLDQNQSGDSDDEILTAALERMENPPDLMMVHFHSIDDIGHRFGDLNPLVMETIRRNDKYVESLVQAWTGSVYILADHGMHQRGDAGYHGLFRFEDMVVPLIKTQGGKSP